MLVFSVVDGRMAYVHGPYTGVIGLWIDCRRHKCANVGQVTGQCIYKLWVLLMGARGDCGGGPVELSQKSLQESSSGLTAGHHSFWRVTL